MRGMICLLLIFICISCTKGFKIMSDISMYNEDVYLASFSDVSHAVKIKKIPSAQWHYDNYGKGEGRILRQVYIDNYTTYQNFHERPYRIAFPDVDRVIKEGKLFSGFQHFILYGRKEGRHTYESYRNAIQYSLEDYYEDAYLLANPDVRRAVASKVYVDGYSHFTRFGKKEGRHLKEKYKNICRFFEERAVIKKSDVPSIGYGSHRGLTMAPYKENTVDAVSHSIQNGYSIEVDVRLTKDNVPVLLHDATLERTTPYSGNVADKLYSEVGDLPLLNDILKLPYKYILLDYKVKIAPVSNESRVIYISSDIDFLNSVKAQGYKTCYFFPYADYKYWEGDLINSYMMNTPPDYVAGFSSVFPVSDFNFYSKSWNIIVFYNQRIDVGKYGSLPVGEFSEYWE